MDGETAGARVRALPNAHSIRHGRNDYGVWCEDCGLYTAGGYRKAEAAMLAAHHTCLPRACCRMCGACVVADVGCIGCGNRTA